MKTARELMTPNPKFVQSGEELIETLQLFLTNEIHYAPVVTPMGKVLGLLSEISLVKASLRQYMESGKHEKVVHHQDLLEEAAFVIEDDGLDEVLKTLIKSPSHRVLVMSKTGKLIGIISPKDILALLSGEGKKTINLRAELDSAKVEAEKLSMQLKNMAEALARYQKLFSDTPYMMHSVDAQGVIQMANKKIHSVLGYIEGELIGRSLNDLYPKSVQHEAFDGLKRIMEQGYHHTTYTSMMTKSGQKVRVDIASSSLRDNEGRFIGTISISREVDSENLLRSLHGVLGTKILHPTATDDAE